HLVVGEVAHPGVGVDVEGGADLLGSRAPDAEDVGEGDLEPLVAGDVDAGDACHGSGGSPLALALLVARVGADDLHAPVAADHLALLTDGLDARTYLHGAPSLVAVGDATPGEVVGRELHLHPVTREDADVVHAHLAGDVGQHLVAVLELDTEHRVGEGLHDGPLHDDRIFLWFRQGGWLLHVLWNEGGRRRAGTTGSAESRLNMLARRVVETNSRRGGTCRSPDPARAAPDGAATVADRPPRRAPPRTARVPAGSPRGPTGDVREGEAHDQPRRRPSDAPARPGPGAARPDDHPPPVPHRRARARGHGADRRLGPPRLPPAAAAAGPAA